MQEIITHGVYLDAQDTDGETALWLACSYRQQDSVKILLEAGSNPNIASTDKYTSLHVALNGGCSKNIISAILDHGADVNARNKMNVTALMIACKNRNKDVINVLLNDGADRDIADAAGDTWLPYAIHNDRCTEVLQAIISHGVDVNATNKGNVTALMRACESGNKEAINVLLSVGTDPNIADADGDTCLHYTARNDQSTEVLQAIISHDVGVDVNVTNKENVTALMIACKEMREKDAIHVLLTSGADPNIADADGDTWLHYAVQTDQRTEVLQAIISHGVGVDVNATNKKNVTSLMIACKAMRKKDTIRALLTAGADPNIADADGDTWLHYAAQNYQCSEILQAIIGHCIGVDVNATNKKNVTALMIACKEMSEKEAIDILLNAGADTNIADADDDTWLHYAAQNDQSTEILQAIIVHDVGVDVNVTNKENITALAIACEEMSEKDAIDILLNAGADPNIANADGDTWFHYAAQNSFHPEVLQAIISHGVGVDVNATNTKNVTALMIACKIMWEKDAIYVLLNAGADPNIADADGDTWLHYAAQNYRCTEILQAIISHGVDVNATNKYNITALMKACHNGNLAGINVLLNAAADIKIVDDFERTCLHYIFYNGNGDLQACIDHCTDITDTNIKPETALVLQISDLFAVSVFLKLDLDPSIPIHNHICKELLQAVTDLGADLYVVKDENAAAQLLACNRALTTCMNVLLRSGADTSTVDVLGDTCLHKILQREYMSLEYDHETLQMLLDHGVPVNSTNKNHQTAYMLAFYQGSIDAMCALLKAGADPNITRYDDKDVDDSNLHHIDTGSFINVTLQNIMKWLNPAWHYLDLPVLRLTECLSSNVVSHIICKMMRHAICKRK